MKIPLRPQPAIYPCPVLVVGSQDAAGKPNLMVASWGGLASMMPPALSVAIRPETHTHANILETGAFTVAIPRASQMETVDLLGTATGAKVDKFSLAGLTLARSGKVPAPYADEFPVVMECEVVANADLGSHTLFVGRIVGLLADDGITDGKSLPKLDAVDPLALSPAGYTYHASRPEPIGRAFRVAGDKAKEKAGRNRPLLAGIALALLLALSAVAVVSCPGTKPAMEAVGRAAAAGGLMVPR